MSTMFCALCGRPVEARRHIGTGTIALGIITGGLWFLAVPFYPKRCSICLSTAVSATPPDPDSARRPSTAVQGPALQTRLADLERRLSLTETELESANLQIERLRSEQDFYRKLLEDPARRRTPPSRD